VVTDTYDAAGKITQKRDPSGISHRQLKAALAPFQGLIQQTPPMYSAVKHQGQRLYELARAGIMVERKSRQAKIYNLEIIDWQPPVVTVEIKCGKGTYIRSLAHDLGQSLGCGAILKSLIRSSYGPFNIENAVSVPQLEDACHYGYWQHFVHPIDYTLLHWSAIVVSDSAGHEIRKGLPVTLPTEVNYPEQHPQIWSPAESHCRAYTIDGHFLGILRFNHERRQWQPRKVFL
jgi:tRNA pseudouridine55 synthase